MVDSAIRSSLKHACVNCGIKMKLVRVGLTDAEICSAKSVSPVAAVVADKRLCICVVDNAVHVLQADSRLQPLSVYVSSLL
jgi:hypothetical protein